MLLSNSVSGQLDSFPSRLVYSCIDVTWLLLSKSTKTSIRGVITPPWALYHPHEKPPSGGK